MNDCTACRPHLNVASITNCDVDRRAWLHSVIVHAVVAFVACTLEAGSAGKILNVGHAGMHSGCNLESPSAARKMKMLGVFSRDPHVYAGHQKPQAPDAQMTSHALASNIGSSQNGRSFGQQANLAGSTYRERVQP